VVPTGLVYGAVKARRTTRLPGRHTACAGWVERHSTGMREYPLGDGYPDTPCRCSLRVVRAPKRVGRSSRRRCTGSQTASGLRTRDRHVVHSRTKPPDSCSTGELLFGNPAAAGARLGTSLFVLWPRELARRSWRIECPPCKAIHSREVHGQNGRAERASDGLRDSDRLTTAVAKPCTSSPGDGSLETAEE